jgi:cyclophilin family peptidyl-prolyl cis-trans isomerase
MKGKIITVIILIALLVLVGWLTRGKDGGEGAKDESNMSSQNPVVVLETNQGSITIELFADQTPKTAENFLKLAQTGFYNDTKFHRVIKDFMIQGGDPLSKDDSQQALWGTGGPGYKFEDEFVSGLSNVRGTISMANSGPNTNGSQFFINTVDNSRLDNRHTVFGKVTSGMEVVDTIGTTPTGPKDLPVEPVVIQNMIVQ